MTPNDAPAQATPIPTPKELAERMPPRLSREDYFRLSRGRAPDPRDVPGIARDSHRVEEMARMMAAALMVVAAPSTSNLWKMNGLNNSSAIFFGRPH